MSPDRPGRDVVLAAVENYGWEHVRPFVESLQATGFDGDIVFFVWGVSDETVARLGEAGVRVQRPRRLRLELGEHVFHPYNTRLTRLRWRGQPFIRHAARVVTWFSRDRLRARARLFGALSNVDVARYCWYYDYLAREGSRYRNVMISDVRDVLFLGDPFDFEIGDGVHVFLEDALTLNEQVNNRGWLAGAYGPHILDELGERPISCSGVTTGAVPAVQGYLAAMVSQIARLPRQFKGMDQGVHNYLVHKGLVPGVRVVGNRQGAVLTVGVMEPAAALSALRERAHEIRVVHQYDRHPVLHEELTGPASTELLER